jgi:hypothetical protein
MISDLNEMALDLDRQIAIEQERAGVLDTNHYAYPTFAKAAIQRRDNLLASAANLEAKLAIARETLVEALQELKKIELLEARQEKRLAASWQRYPLEKSKDFGRDVRAGTMIALMAGIVSVGFGCLVGLLVRRLICGS